MPRYHPTCRKAATHLQLCRAYPAGSSKAVHPFFQLLTGDVHSHGRINALVSLALMKGESHSDLANSVFVA